MSYTEESVNDLAQSYFREYQLQCALNPNKMIQELDFWETGDNVIFDMPLEQQSTYADYVTNKICGHGPHAAEQLAELSIHQFSINGYAQKKHACAVGNYAKLISTINNPILKEKHLKMHNQMIQYAKEHPVQNIDQFVSECVIN